MGAPPPPEIPPGPQAAPMAQPTANEGARQIGLVSVQAAADALTQALSQLGSMSPEGQAVISALKALSKFTGPAAQQLVPAQIMELSRAQQQSPIQDLMAGGGAAAPMPA